MAVLSDPTGAVFCLWEAGTHRGAELVNQAGTWNWSDLNTRDPEAAKAFYGAVFGWVAESVDLGEAGEAIMWRAPGYGDFLEQLAPGNRRRQTEAGAPPGFADAIGWMSPMTPDQFPDDVPSHWSVTFAVDDVDAIAATAEQRGGQVLTAPFDAGAARIAVHRRSPGCGLQRQQVPGLSGVAADGNRTRLYANLPTDSAGRGTLLDV